MSEPLPNHILAANLTNVELGVVAAIHLRSQDAEPRMPEWNKLAEMLGVSKQMICKIKARLVETGRLLDAPWGLRLNPSMDVWVAPANRKSKGLLSILDDLSGDQKPRNPVNPQVDRKPESVNPQVDCERSPVNPQVDSPRTPNKEAGARAICTIVHSSLKEGECEGESEAVRWRPDQVESLAGWVVRKFTPLTGESHARSFAVDLRKNIDSFTPDYLKVAIKYCYAKMYLGHGERVKNPYGLVFSLATEWERDDAIPSSAEALIEQARLAEAEKSRADDEAEGFRQRYPIHRAPRDVIPMPVAAGA